MHCFFNNQHRSRPPCHEGAAEAEERPNLPRGPILLPPRRHVTLACTRDLGEELTGSAGQAGLVFFFFALSGLFVPIAGLVVDRVRRRPLLFWVNLLTGVMVLALFAVHSRDQVWVIVIVRSSTGSHKFFLARRRVSAAKVMLPEAA